MVGHNERGVDALLVLSLHSQTITVLYSLLVKIKQFSIVYCPYICKQVITEFRIKIHNNVSLGT